MITKIENENKNLLCGKNQSKECIYIDMPCMQGSLNTIQEHIFNENI